MSLWVEAQCSQSIQRRSAGFIGPDPPRSDQRAPDQALARTNTPTCARWAQKLFSGSHKHAPARTGAGAENTGFRNHGEEGGGTEMKRPHSATPAGTAQEREREARMTINKLVDDGVLVRLKSGWVVLRKHYVAERDGPELRPPKKR
jgi:hypothetical protein